ncbi:hypothetical protein HGM15179_008808, partial [Zosterops borbonicus]
GLGFSHHNKETMEENMSQNCEEISCCHSIRCFKGYKICYLKVNKKKQKLCRLLPSGSCILQTLQGYTQER